MIAGLTSIHEMPACLMVYMVSNHSLKWTKKSDSIELKRRIIQKGETVINLTY